MTRLISRAEWGARPARGVSYNISPERGGCALHWEGPRMGDFPHSSCATKVRGIQAFHMDGRGWGDIAYTMLPCPHGDVFMGRGPGVRTAANGTNDGNDRFYAICYLGGEGDPLTEEGKAAFLFSIEYLRRSGDAGPQVRGHRQIKATACPGDPIQAWINAGLPPPAGLPQGGSLMFEVWYKDGDTTEWLVLLAAGFAGVRWKISTTAASRHYRESKIPFKRKEAWELDRVRVSPGNGLA